MSDLEKLSWVFLAQKEKKKGIGWERVRVGLKKEGKGKKCRNHEDRLRDNIGEQV